MVVIAFLAQKGGVGKSTLSINVADALHRESNRVLVIDADPQASASDWSSVRPSAPWRVISLPPADLSAGVLTHAQAHDHVIIDGPPGAVAITRAIIVAADLVIIPMVPSALSKWSADMTMQQIHQAAIHKPSLQAAVVITQAIPRTTIANVLRDSLTDAGLPVLATTIVSRVAHAEALSQGLTIYEYQPHGAAALEITQLVHEIGALYVDKKNS